MCNYFIIDYYLNAFNILCLFMFVLYEPINIFSFLNFVLGHSQLIELI